MVMNISDRDQFSRYQSSLSIIGKNIVDIFRKAVLPVPTFPYILQANMSGIIEGHYARNEYQTAGV